jgi:tetratricopeptide (TPR) repeat protein
MDKLSQALPEQAVLLQGRLRQMEADAQFVATEPTQADGTGRREGESQQDYAERHVDSLEEQARKETDPLRRDIAYAKAAIATGPERYERAVSLAEKIRDESLSRNLTNWLSSRSSLYFAGAGNFDRAYELLKKNDDATQRAVCLVVGAQNLVKAKDPLRAGQWLQEARSIINDAEPDEALARVALGAVYAYAQFDQMRALELLDDAVKLMNRSPLASAADEKAPQVERFSGFANADYTRGTQGFGLNAAVGAFGAARFDGVLSSIDKITNAELRGGAIVTLCRNAMRAEPPAGVAGASSLTGDRKR